MGYALMCGDQSSMANILMAIAALEIVHERRFSLAG